MILTYEFGLNLVHVNCHTEYPDQRIFRLNITVETHRHTKRTNHTIWWTTEVVGKNMRTRNDHSALKWGALRAMRVPSDDLQISSGSCYILVDFAIVKTSQLDIAVNNGEGRDSRRRRFLDTALSVYAEKF